MYGYKEFIPLTVEEILKRVSQEEIFKIVLKKDIVVDKEFKYLAPYRNDTHPDCYLEYYDGELRFVDFANVGKKTENCFGIISKTYNINYLQSLEYVNDYFDLGLGNSSSEAKEIIYENGSVNVEEITKKFKKKRTITYLPRKFSSKDKKFWQQYEISKNNLIEDKVIPIEIFKSTSRKGEPYVVKPFDIMYAYTDFEDSKVKVYRPYAPKESKWFTNCTQDDIGSINSLPWVGEKLIISKSYKDCRVIRNQGLNAIWFQNEGMIPNPTIIKQLCKRFKEIYVWFDNDQAGLANGKFVTDYINSICKNKAKFIFLPPKLLKEYNIKDPSDLISKQGKQKLLDFLKQKNLINEPIT